MITEIFEDASYSQDAASYLGELLRDRHPGRPFHLFLSGGSTPKPIYHALAQASLDWNGVHFWLGDERYVPWDHPDSNYRMVCQTLLDPLAIPSSQRHPWPILSSPELSAETYDRELRATFERRGEMMDLQLLGLGADGHTASLFPGSQALQETRAWAVANVVTAHEKNRLTLTFPALNASLRAVFLVQGEAKAQMVGEVVAHRRHPAGRVQGRQATIVLLDRSAAGHLPSQSPPQK